MVKIKTHPILSKYENIGMHNQLPIIWKKAKGCYVYDNKNKKILDFTSTIFVTNIGHGNKRLIKYIKSVLDKPILHTYNYANNYRLKYVKHLVKFSGKNFGKVFLLSGGSETTEAALKLMRLYAIKKKKRKPGIISLLGNWHGRTMGSQLMCGNYEQKKWMGFRDSNIHHLKFPYPWTLKNNDPKIFFENSLKKLKKKINFKKDICGFILETFQGWGALFYPKKYISAVSKFCKLNDILLTFDEMQSGFGRTGKKFGYEHYNVKPDIICCGKGMGSGFPLSGLIAKQKIIDLGAPGSMSSTHSANPLACAAGLATIEEINRKKLVFKSHINGIYLHKGLKHIKNKFPDFIYSIEGKGLIAAIIFKKNIKLKNINTGTKLADKICIDALKNKLLLVRTGRESIKIGPPLIISRKEIKDGLIILSKTIQSIVNKNS